MNRLKEIRKNHKLTALVLANAVNTSRSNISMIENGFRKADIDLAKRIADYFKSSIEDIFFASVSHETGHNQPTTSATGTD